MRSLARVAVGLAFGAVVLTITMTSCEDPVGAPRDITAVSDVKESHYHSATIAGSDIVNPPPNGRTYTSTTAMGHTHRVLLNEQQLLDLQQKGAVVSVASSAEGAPSHFHTFTFEN